MTLHISVQIIVEVHERTPPCYRQLNSLKRQKGESKEMKKRLRGGFEPATRLVPKIAGNILGTRVTIQPLPLPCLH